ncbi:DUF5694 domain-containing protein [Pedobacter sp. MC2016-05]|uniref:DUF5694 domain-containing protein n=1 Tax=Pedobacter sp. MC2016-05 TaxID=2994474 RepID=UPI002246892D|nr:DUF5694 domain-containing protein [Pedobacter sp. MC2016-05]MCX2475281.1 DUF5694 domain-containing protein [Pedobacter sp. MC2016-05]
MKLKFTLLICLIATSLVNYAQTSKTDILILGSDHLGQIYKKEFPTTDVFMPQAQKSVIDFTNSVTAYRPDMVCVEILPKYQGEIDSLYSLYSRNKLDFKSLEDGRSEVYQIAFRIAKEMKLKKIYCVNAPGGTSQSILDNGDNIEIYKKEGLELRAYAVEKLTQLQKGTISFKDYLHFGNQPEIAQKVYHLRYVTPSRVINGRFKNPDSMIDTAYVNPKYIGAELTSVFKNRDYKIYSNIVTGQMEARSKRILLVIGVAHIGSLKNILRDDSEYNIIDIRTYLKK